MRMLQLQKKLAAAETEAGLGMFFVSRISDSVSVSLYWGHLVDDQGSILIPCETTVYIYIYIYGRRVELDE